MRRTALLGLALLVGTVTSLEAQDTVVIQQFKCDINEIESLRAQADTIWIPVADELVSEGKFQYVQVLERDMGDEWNVLWYYRAADMETYRAATEEWGVRVEDRFPVANAMYNRDCPEYTQYSYRSVSHTGNE